MKSVVFAIFACATAFAVRTKADSVTSFDDFSYGTL